MTTAFLFPGQGAQTVGMGNDLYEAFAAAKAVFDAAEEVSRLPLKKLCFEGPEQELNRTDVAQPAIFTVSAAILACMDNLLEPPKVERLRPAFMAGLSLGEYTALFAAGMIDFEDALRLVVRRGQAMQSAATSVPSGMVSIMGLDQAQAEKLCQAAANGEVLSCANFNCPGQIVLSGTLDACRRAEAMAKDAGASGAVALKVAGAFHSDIMKPAADELRHALEATAFRPPPDRRTPGDPTVLAKPSDAQRFAWPDIQVLANVDARPYDRTGAPSIRLLAQLTGSVRWQQSMEYLLAQGVETFYEIGPGRVLSGLMRRINRKATVMALNSREAIEKLAAPVDVSQGKVTGER